MLPLCGGLLAGPAVPQATRPPVVPDALAAGFRDPPPSAKPRVWWHWMNGNITRDGIRRDLDWMNRIGIGGVNAIDAAIDTPQVVKKRLIYMTPEWQGAFRYAAGLADRYGMELSIDSSPGWSETGGPWVSPQAAMKKLAWSSTGIDGGKPFHGVLPLPPAVAGPFQNIPRAAPGAPSFYRDSIVVAYRAPVDEPKIVEATASSGMVDAATLSDGDLTNGAVLTPDADDRPVWLRFAYRNPTRLQGLTLAVAANEGQGFTARIETSGDDRNWRLVTEVPKPAQVRRFALLQQTISFPPVTGRYFRLVLMPDAPIPASLRVVERAAGAADAPAAPSSPAPRAYHVHELVFHAHATVNEFEKKAGFAIARDNYAIASGGDIAPGSAARDVVALSDRMRPDGTFDWTPPPGHWVVLRMGYSLTGTQNHPATAEATGLEVDKLSRAHVRDYMEHYLATYEKAAGPGLFGRRGLNALTVDSIEVGAQNWTEAILDDFRRLRGYDPTPWLPALTGMAVRSPADSDRFLWDFRRTISDLLAENHYAEIAAIAHRHSLLNYAEALEDHRPGFGDDIDMRRFADIPMAAMWTYGSRREPLPTYVADIQGAASVAHVYGRSLAAAESLTSAGQPWAYAPRALKPVVDLEFALGVNRVVVHTSVHQPVDRPPGLSLFAYGQFFNRLESWANEAGAWMRYIARCSWLLQQGRYAADIAYFYGEEAPLTGLYGDAPVADVPTGYAFDFVGSDAIALRLSVDHGDLVTASGMRYRVLYLGGSSRLMTLGTLRQILDLVRRGAVLVGRRPQGSPSLADDNARFQNLADDLFGPGDGERKLGDGRVFSSLADAFAALKLAPDFAYSKPEADTEILSLHRRLKDGELYFVSNRLERPENITAAFRVSGMDAEIWNPVNGEIVRAPVTEADGRSSVALALAPYGSAFVVFRRHSDAKSAAGHVRILQTLDGPWNIAFQPGRGAPDHAVEASLQSWSSSDNPGIKYFSGEAVYAKTFNLSQPVPGARLTLDLGDVREVAEVSLNGKTVGTAWTPPFTLDITGAAKPGVNVLKIKVANLWVNRLIGDAQPVTVKKYTFATIPTYRADAPLRVSGLLGPVTIRQIAP